MYEHDPKKYARDTVTLGIPSAKELERRGADRHAFTASAEVRELSSGARFSTRTTDLGPGGCFVDTMIPFPIGSRVQVSVRKERNAFEATGTVVYAQAGLGMGISFDPLDAQQREALDAWLGEFGWQSTPAEQGPQLSAEPMQSRTMNHQAALVRLVRLMIGKGLLTEAEGSSVLYDPVL